MRLRFGYGIWNRFNGTIDGDTQELQSFFVGIFHCFSTILVNLGHFVLFLSLDPSSANEKNLIKESFTNDKIVSNQIKQWMLIAL